MRLLSVAALAALPALTAPVVQPPAAASVATLATDSAYTGALFAYDRRAPLDLRDTLERVDRDVEVHRVSFASPRGGRATGFIVVPLAATRATTRLAGVVLLHGAPGDAAQQLGRAERLCRLGAVVFALDAPFARRDPQAPIAFSERDSADQVQLIVDLQRAVDVLVARRDVDAKRLGYVGGSYGGAYGALFAGVERRLHAYALATADGGFGMHFTGPDGAPQPAPDGITPDAWRHWLASSDAVSSIHYVGRAAPAHLLFQYGRTDPIVTPVHARTLYAAASEPKEIRWYDSGHAMPPAAKDDALDWLAGQLGLRTLTAAERAEPSSAAPIAPNSQVLPQR